MALNAVAIASGIAALSVTGVTIKDLDEIPVDITRAGMPLLMPDPDNWGGETSANMETFGFAANSMWTVTRTLGYVYFHAIVGTERSPSVYYTDMSNNRDAIIEALLELDIDGVDVVGVNSGKFTQLADMSGKSFHGFLMGVLVREKVNA